MFLAADPFSPSTSLLPRRRGMRALPTLPLASPGELTCIAAGLRARTARPRALLARLFGAWGRALARGDAESVGTLPR